VSGSELPPPPPPPQPTKAKLKHTAQTGDATKKVGRAGLLHERSTNTDTQLTQVQNISGHISYYRQARLKMRLFFYISLDLTYLLRLKLFTLASAGGE
jgi:hypothetical protein